MYSIYFLLKRQDKNNFVFFLELQHILYTLWEKQILSL